MLIRSQNKKVIAVLENCDAVSIYEMNRIYHIVTYNGTKESKGSIGEYSTEKKAIKVMDMIQDAYLESTEVIINGEISCKVMPRAIVFQMPQDSEV